MFITYLIIGGIIGAVFYIASIWELHKMIEESDLDLDEIKGDQLTVMTLNIAFAIVGIIFVCGFMIGWPIILVSFGVSVYAIYKESEE